MRLKLALAVTLILAAAVLVALQKRGPVLPVDEGETTAAPVRVQEAARAVAADTPSPAGKPEDAPPQPLLDEAQTAAPVDEAEFKLWVKSEAKQMDMPRVDSDRKTREMNTVAAELNPQQRQQLLQTVRSASAGAGEKILSTYLLVQAGPRAAQELKELISSPVSSPGPAHSEAEVNNMRDKTLRIMAIDGLASQAQSDAKARETLAKTIDQIQDPYVKDYARKQLSRIQR